MEEYVSLNPYPVEKRTSVLAVFSFWSAVFSYLLFPFIGAVVAVLCAYLAKGEIRASNGQLNGDDLANAGLVLGYAHLGVVSLVFACGLALAIALLVMFLVATFSTALTDVRTLYGMQALM